MKGIINKHENILCVEFDETQYMEDGLDYQGNDTVEIHPEDIIKFNIGDDNIGDAVKYKDLSVLPERCATVSDMKITYFRENAIVGTDKDLYPTSDGSAYSHFVRGN